MTPGGPLIDVSHATNPILIRNVTSTTRLSSPDSLFARESHPRAEASSRPGLGGLAARKTLTPTRRNGWLRASPLRLLQQSFTHQEGCCDLFDCLANRLAACLLHRYLLL